MENNLGWILCQHCRKKTTPFSLFVNSETGIQKAIPQIQYKNFPGILPIYINEDSTETLEFLENFYHHPDPSAFHMDSYGSSVMHTVLGNFCAHVFLPWKPEIQARCDVCHQVLLVYSSTFTPKRVCMPCRKKCKIINFIELSWEWKNNYSRGDIQKAEEWDRAQENFLDEFLKK